MFYITNLFQKRLDHDVTSYSILEARKEETLGSTFLPYQSVCAKSVCNRAHLTLLRQRRSFITFQLYGSGLSPVHRHRFFPSPANSGPQISGLFTAGLCPTMAKSARRIHSWRSRNF